MVSINQLPAHVRRELLQKENMQGAKISNTAKPNKFNAKKVKNSEGKVIADSIAEREFETGYLTIKSNAGLIKDVVKWPTVQLTKYIKWKIDFSWFDVEKNRTVWCDVKGGKGTQDGRFLTLKQLWRSHGPGTLLIAMYNYKSKTWMIDEAKTDKH